MAMQLPAVNDNDYDLLKKLVYNIAQLNGGGGGDVTLAGNNAFTGLNTFAQPVEADSVIIPTGSSGGFQLYKTGTESDDNWRRLGIRADDRFLIYSERSALGLDAIGLDFGVIGNGGDQSHYYMNRPNQGGNIPGHQFWVTDITAEKQDGLFHFYTANGTRLLQTSGTNRFLDIEPYYNQTSGTASNTDLAVIRRGVGNVGSGTQRLISLMVAAADESPTEKFGVDPDGNALVSGAVNFQGADTNIRRNGGDLLFTAGSVLGFTLNTENGGLMMNSSMDIFLSRAAVAETVSPTHTMLIKDSTGTSYKVLCTPA